MNVGFGLYGSLLLLAALLGGAVWVFARVRADYRRLGRLSPPIAVLQTGYFCAYALSAYAFLDSRWSHVTTDRVVLFLAVICMAIGFLVVLFSMPFLGRRSFGMEVGTLRTSGLYRFSRNPQLVGFLVFVVGYALLWPSWTGAAWAALWVPIARLMVRNEEEHLEQVFGEAYREYCRRTPRWVGLRRA